MQPQKIPKALSGGKIEQLFLTREMHLNYDAFPVRSSGLILIGSGVTTRWRVWELLGF